MFERPWATGGSTPHHVEPPVLSAPIYSPPSSHPSQVLIISPSHRVGPIGPPEGDHENDAS